jgi:predicted TIM-barrel fold metal-dependent hydrolase
MAHTHSIHDCAMAGCSTSRRHFLAGTAALGAAALLPAELAAQAAPRHGLIDLHHHHFPKPYKEFANQWAAAHGEQASGLVNNWSIEKTLGEMDKAGVQTAILSISPAGGGWFAQPAADRAKMVRLCNDSGAQDSRDHPGRFGLFAALPMPDIDASLKEIAYALDTLKADGVGLFTSFGDKWPGEADYAPVWEELNRRKAIVYFHPYAPNCCGSLVKGIPDSILEYPYETPRTILSLLFNGALAKYRDIKWLFSHGGAALPTFAGRINQLSRLRAETSVQAGGGFAPNGIDYELKRLYFEIANAFYKPSMDAIMDYMPLSQLVFGTDYPYVGVSDTANGLDKLGLNADSLAAIQRGNAMALLPRLKG